METLANPWGLPDVVNHEWNDFPTLFTPSGKALDHVQASDATFGAAVDYLGGMLEPEEMEWERNVMD